MRSLAPQKLQPAEMVEADEFSWWASGGLKGDS